MALETFIPPPPGSNRGAEHRNFLSGAMASTVVLLSMAGLRVSVTIFSITIT
jgi:hypothetical protein